MTPPRPAASGRLSTPRRGTPAFPRTFAPGRTGTPTSRAPTVQASWRAAGLRRGRAAHPAEEPRTGHAPIASHHGRRNGQRVGDFFFREPAEEPQFHDASLSRVEGRELRESVVEMEHVHPTRGGRVHRLVERHANPLTLGGTAAP